MQVCIQLILAGGIHIVPAASTPSDPHHLTPTQPSHPHTPHTVMFRNQAPGGRPLTHSTLAAGGVLGLEDNLPGMGPIQDMVFYGGHARYPNCTIHTARILNLKGHPSNLRMDWEWFRMTVEKIKDKQLLEVRVLHWVVVPSCGRHSNTAHTFLHTHLHYHLLFTAHHASSHRWKSVASHVAGTCAALRVSSCEVKAQTWTCLTKSSDSTT